MTGGIETISRLPSENCLDFVCTPQHTKPLTIRSCHSQASFIMPTSYPIVLDNLNWTPITLGVTLLAVLVGWFMPRYGAAMWYHGKSHTLADDTAVSVLPHVAHVIPSQLNCLLVC
jgi:hypothetical protein